MSAVPKTYSVQACADLCGVGRSTVNYWIKTGKLRAKQTGKRYQIPENELLLYLQSEGRDIPAPLKKSVKNQLLYRELVNCWEYWDGRDQRHAGCCQDCVVYNKGLDVCFAARKNTDVSCTSACVDCGFYQEYIQVRINFIHQIASPAAIYKELHFWGANQAFSQVTGYDAETCVGMGLEHLIHPDSLPTAITNMKRRMNGDPNVPTDYSVYISTKDDQKVKISIGIHALSEPPGTYLAIGNKK